MDLAIELKDIHTYYGRSHVIHGTSMFVYQQETVSILGRNGVGKTTTLRSIIGLTPPSYGNIFINGHDITGLKPYQIVKYYHVAYVPAERHIFPGLSVEENLKLASTEGPDSSYWSLSKIYETFPILDERKHLDGSRLSGGEQQMLAIARGLMVNPSIMLLDEPSQGLAPKIVSNIINIIKHLQDEHNLTTIIVEQNYKVANRLASRHYLMDTKGIINDCLTSDDSSFETKVHDHLTI